jgi:hypothetical protein
VASLRENSKFAMKKKNSAERIGQPAQIPASLAFTIFWTHATRQPNSLVYLRLAAAAMQRNV